MTILDKNRDVAIFYATDGSVPTRSSQRYTHPITLTGNGAIRAFAATSTKQSRVVRANYICNALGSIALSGTHAVDSGSLSQSIDIFDYTNPNQPPPPTTFIPGNLGIGLSSDLDGVLSAVGDQGSSKADLVDISVPKVVATCLPPACQASTGINAVSINAGKNLVAVGSNNDFNMYLIDFINRSAPSAKLVPPPGGAGGWTVALDSSGIRLAAGNVVGTNVALFSVAGNTATLLKNWTSKINAVNTICMSSPPPALAVNPNSLAFSYTQGGTVPAPQTLSASSTSGVLSFTSSTSGGVWLSATGSGNTPGSVSVSVNTTGLGVGTYSGLVTVTSAGASNSPQTITVILTVSRTSTPAMTLSATSFAFSYTQGGAVPGPLTLSVGSTSGVLSFTTTASGGGTWLTATGSGNTPGSVSVSANTTGLGVGTYAGSVIVTSPGASNGPQTIPVTLTVTQPVSTITIGLPADPGQGDYYPFGGYSGRYQQVYSASAFTGPITIKELRFFNTQANSGATSMPSGTWTIALSMTSANWNTLSSNFAANVGPNNLSQLWAFGKTLIITLSTPFTYVPANGNLLIDVNVSGLTPPPTLVYFDTTGYDACRRDGSTIIGHVDKDGVVNGYGLATGFTF